MERITSRTISGRVIVPIKQHHHEAPVWKNPFEPAVERLAAIEDILGDNYDLDQLRELVEGWRNGWLRVILTAPKPGDSVYWLLEDDGWYISDPEKVADVGAKGFYLSGVRDSDEPGDNPSFIPWDEIGKTVFLSREEAEAALAKMKEG